MINESLKRKILRELVSDLDTIMKKHLCESKEPDFTVSDINGTHRVYDLKEVPELKSALFNDEPTRDDITSLNKWLRQHRDDYVRLYHGTSSELPITDKGLLKTSVKRKRSLQSEPVFVYLSIFPTTARTFGEFGYPRESVTVYAVDVKVSELKPDTDQLKNKRMWCRDIAPDIRDTLGDSLAFGHGARIKRDILPYEIKTTRY